MDVVERALMTIKDRKLCNKNRPALLMVSGGGDSTALAYIVKELQEESKFGTFKILHVNHCLRGEEADKDQEFVQGLAQLLNIPFEAVVIDIPSLHKETSENIEALARRLRYRAAQEVLARQCQNEMIPLSEGRILVAHNADDRIENFYMRSIVGTGPGGFRSMKYKNRRIVRPLLDIGRDELRRYIRQRQQDGLPVMRDETGALWREDATNSHTDRFRSFVRCEIVPRAKERNPQLIETLTRTMNLIGDEDDMLTRAVDKRVDRWVEWLEPVEEACIISPDIAHDPVPLQRRLVAEVLRRILGDDCRIETRSIDAVLAAFCEGDIISGYVNNIQGNLAVSANKSGVRIEPMAAYRTRRKKD